MPASRTFDRRWLGNAGYLLDDVAYAQVIAELGVEPFQAPPGPLSPATSLVWRPNIFIERRLPMGLDPAFDLLQERLNAWQDRARETSIERIILHSEDFNDNTMDMAEVWRVLARSDIGVPSIFAGRKMPDADLRWQWPVRISAFPETIDALDLERLTGVHPAKKLAHVQPLSRSESRSEILIMSGSVREALRRVLELSYRVRTCHVVLVGPLDFVWWQIGTHVDTLLAETQAAAISFVSVSNEGFAARINQWVTELSHNRPYDLTLGQPQDPVPPPFPRESSLHVLDFRIFDRTALPTVATDLGERLKELPREHKLRIPASLPPKLNLDIATSRLPTELGDTLIHAAPDLPFTHETEGGTILSEIAGAEREARREVATSESPRFLQADVARFSDGQWIADARGLVVENRYRLEIFISPDQERAISVEHPVPEDEIDWKKANSVKLQVLFTEPSQWETPFQGEIELPRDRAMSSSRCRFDFSPTKPGPFAGRITLYHRGRVLQTALMEGSVVARERELENVEDPVRFSIEVEVRRSLDTLSERRRFDACLILNHGPRGNHSATAAGPHGAYIAALDGIAPQLVNINGYLNQVANDTERYSKGLKDKHTAKLLCDLAAEGNFLYRSLVVDYINRSSAAEALKDDYLQIVSARPDAIVPLEFVYELPPPKRGAKVCDNAAQALCDGKCPASCVPKGNPAPHVCPLGFWGLKKVIERHVHDPELPKAAHLRSEPIKDRDVLSLAGTSLLAASEQVPPTESKALATYMKKIWKGSVSVVTWKAWRATVKKNRPVLFLALPHADGAGAQISLEISGDTLESRFIDQSYVRPDQKKPAPVVLLLGCDTANVAFSDAYARHIAVFRQADAALVLGTVATVFGADAAKVAMKLVERIVDTAKKSAERFGEVLRQVKREAVAEGQLTALCLVAFGDADWRLK